MSDGFARKATQELLAGLSRGAREDYIAQGLAAVIVGVIGAALIGPRGALTGHSDSFSCNHPKFDLRRRKDSSDIGCRIRRSLAEVRTDNSFMHWQDIEIYEPLCLIATSG